MARNFSGKPPDLILCSPAVRAYATALAYVTENDWPLDLIRLEQSLWHSNAKEHLALIAKVDKGYQHVFIVGHNPGLEDLARRLCPVGDYSLATCALLKLNFDVDRWQGIGKASATIEEFRQPKNCPR